MSSDYNQAAHLFAIAASAARLRIMSAVAEKEQTVSQLSVEIGMSQSPVSQHLKRLRDANLVESRRQGVNIYYRLSPGIAEDLFSFIDRNFN